MLPFPATTGPGMFDGFVPVPSTWVTSEHCCHCWKHVSNAYAIESISAPACGRIDPEISFYVSPSAAVARPLADAVAAVDATLITSFSDTFLSRFAIIALARALRVSADVSWNSCTTGVATLLDGGAAPGGDAANRGYHGSPAGLSDASYFFQPSPSAFATAFV